MIKYNEGLYFDENIKCTVYRTQSDYYTCNTYGYLMKTGKPVLLHMLKAKRHRMNINHKTYDRITSHIYNGTKDERLIKLYREITFINDWSDEHIILTYTDKDLLS
jgi:hypothetical protein